MYHEDFVPPAFSFFERNITSRVCPTDAIRFNDDGTAHIDQHNCIKCGLCIHRCPYAAIQFSIEKSKIKVNTARSLYVKKASETEQIKQIEQLKKLPRKIQFKRITSTFCSDYQFKLREKVKMFPDLSEILVRNTLINLGYQCGTKPAGNNHIRTEFFAQVEDKILIGESEITNSDTLSVCRRILDDVTVMISRFGYHKENIIPLSVINGLPNKRTDYYEVVSDIHNILGVQISTITYYLLFVIQLFKIPLKGADFERFFVSKDCDSLIQAIQTHIELILNIDDNISNSGNYSPSK